MRPKQRLPGRLPAVVVAGRRGIKIGEAGRSRTGCAFTPLGSIGKRFFCET